MHGTARSRRGSLPHRSFRVSHCNSVINNGHTRNNGRIRPRWSGRTGLRAPAASGFARSGPLARRSPRRRPPISMRSGKSRSGNEQINHGYASTAERACLSSSPLGGRRRTARAASPRGSSGCFPRPAGVSLRISGPTRGKHACRRVHARSRKTGVGVAAIVAVACILSCGHHVALRRAAS